MLSDAVDINIGTIRFKLANQDLHGLPFCGPSKAFTNLNYFTVQEEHLKPKSLRSDCS